MKTKIILLITLLMSLATFSQKHWSLKDCVEYALKNNITVQQSRLDIDVANATIKESKGNFLPNLNATTGGRLNFNPILNIDNTERTGTDAVFSSDFGLNSGVTLYAGGKNKTTLKQALLTLKNSKLKVQEIENNIALQVVNAYLNILLAKENLNVANTQATISKKQIDMMREKFESGIVAKADLLNTKSSAANDIQNVVIQENALSFNLLKLTQLLQIPSDNFDIVAIDVQLPNLLLYKDSKKVYEKALTNRPEIERAKMDVEKSKLSVNIAKSTYLPTVSANASMGTNYLYGLNNNKNSNTFTNQLNNRFNYGIGLSVSIPIFNGYKTDAGVARAEIQQNISEFALEKQKLNLQQTIEQAYLDTKLAAKTYEATKVSLVAQNEAFKNAQISYNQGAMTQFDFDQVRNRQVKTQGAMIRAKYDYIFKTKVLKFYFGENIID